MQKDDPNSEPHVRTLLLSPNFQFPEIVSQKKKK